MTLPRVRFTLLRMMVAVAIAGALLAVVIRVEQGRRFRARRSAFIALAEKYLAGMGKENALFITGGPTTRWYTLRDGTRIPQARHDHHQHLWEKYWKAADYPWLPVEPDPPEPK